MSYRKINIAVNVGIFSSLGLFSYILLAKYASLPVLNSTALAFIGGYIFFIVAFNIVGFSLLKFSSWVSNRFVFRSIKKWQYVTLYLLCAVSLLMLNYTLLVVAKMLVGASEPYLFPNGGVRILIIVWLLEMIIFALLLVNQSVIHVMKIQREAARLQSENDTAQYMALQNQLNPHFLFNSLNTLIAEIEYDPKNAISFTRNLSDVYRYVLQCQDKRLITLKSELDFMKAYIFLHKVRLGDFITVNMSIADDDLEIEIPPLTLQLLVENIIKHNKISSSYPMTISIFIKDGYINVTNTLNLKKKVEISGTGLHNLSNRCRLTIGKEIITEATNSIFDVKIPILHD